MVRFQVIKSLSLLILLGFTWGSGYCLAKYAMTNGVPPLGYAFWQSLGPAFLLTIVCFIRPKQHLQTNGSSNWLYFLICGLIGIAIPNTNIYFIAGHLPAGLLAVLVNTVPLFVYPIALTVRQEQFDIWRLIALLLGVTGIILIISPTKTGLFSSWTLMALISPLAFALCSIYIAAKQPKHLNITHAARGMLLAASLLLTPLVIQQQAFFSLSPPFTAPKLVVILEIVLSSAGYLLFFKLISAAGPVFYSFTGAVVAITGLFWGRMMFAEMLNTQQMLAIICVISAITLLSWRQTHQQ